MRVRTAPRSALGGGGFGGGNATMGFCAGVMLTLLPAVLLWLHNQHSIAFLETQSHVLPGTDLATAGCTTHAAGHGAAGSTSSTLPLATRLPDLHTAPALMVSFGNAAYFELAHNWAKSVQGIGAPFLIAAFDEGMMEQCLSHSLPCTKVSFGEGSNTNFRGDFAAFRLMGAVKVRFVLELLEQHPTLPLVVVSDTDTVWLREPWDYFADRSSAEFFISTDCLSHQVEEEWKEMHGQPRCGHVPGNGDGHALNTGLFAARNTEAARATLRAWADMLVDPSQERADDPEHRGVDDQLALNNLLDLGGTTPLSNEDFRTTVVYHGRLKLQALPVMLFANGHVAFVQRIPWRLGIAPMVIHATFQRYGLAGKRSRLRAFGLWHMDPPEYYGLVPASPSSHSSRNSDSGGNDTGNSSGGGLQAAAAAAGGRRQGMRNSVPPLRLLSYENSVRQFVDAAEAERYPGSNMPLLEKNWLGMSYQLQALRDALATARMLGRILIMPQPVCWCDYDEHPHILYRCRIKGTDYGVPFECPLDFLLPLDNLDAAGVQYRHAGFLQHPQVPAHIRHSISLVDISPRRPENPFLQPNQLVGHAATVWPGIEQPDLLRVLDPLQSAAVLHLRGDVPGFFGGYGGSAGSVAAAQEMDRLFLSILGQESFFCCFTWGDADDEYRSLKYEWPVPLEDGWQPWKAPKLRLPEWCDRVSSQYGNANFTRLPQHPCAYMRNASLVAIAADGSGQYNRPWRMDEGR
ncbi:hypothetical protein D9Q98_001108 [Chlorella vulgaris]|uniref:Nucleotide-diphospho-sugar transferase domain-containing protein n=1 Tax=Chlorella vulgaris TaxID=3077 RepID=A0A9D4TZJ9_CHLVU|nr:hypothetical protein D9Q98_001108 [Chlorella vulgaris]